MSLNVTMAIYNMEIEINRKSFIERYFLRNASFFLLHHYFYCIVIRSMLVNIFARCVRLFNFFLKIVWPETITWFACTQSSPVPGHTFCANGFLLESKFTFLIIFGCQNDSFLRFPFKNIIQFYKLNCSIKRQIKSYKFNMWFL